MTAQHTDTWTPEDSGPDPYRLRAVGLVVLFVLTLPALFLTMLAWRPGQTSDPLLELAAEFDVDPIALATGRYTFSRNCAICHGPDGHGIPRLGKPLRNSEFVQSHTDAEILSVILNGRDATDPENTSGTPMPARGLNPTVNDERLASVVIFLRTLQDPTEPFASIDDWIVSAPEGGNPDAIGGVGHDAFIASCSACHGSSGEGLPGLGKALATSPFVASKTDDELITFIKQGRPIWDPDNTTGVDMPPKGGNPALQDAQIREIIAYIRQLHGSSAQ